jgi:hypothetical protein
VISPFGVDHGEISKGLSSALKARKVGSPVQDGWRGNAILHRLNAHSAGKQAARLKPKNPYSQPGMMNDRASNQAQYYGFRSKNMYKESLANDAQPSRAKKKRVLP